MGRLGGLALAPSVLGRGKAAVSRDYRGDGFRLALRLVGMTLRVPSEPTIAVIPAKRALRARAGIHFCKLQKDEGAFFRARGACSAMRILRRE